MRRIWGNLRRPENVMALVTVAVAAIVAILELRGGDVGSAGTVSVLGLLALAVLAERLTYLERIERSLAVVVDRAGLPVVETFYASRQNLPPFGAYLQSAEKDFFAVGTNFGYIVGIEMGLLEQKAKEGCRIRLLMTNPQVAGSENPLIGPLNRLFGFTRPTILDQMRHTLNKI